MSRINMKAVPFIVFVLLQVITMASSTSSTLYSSTIKLNKTCIEVNSTKTLGIPADIAVSKNKGTITIAQSSNFFLTSTEVIITPVKNSMFNVSVSTNAMGDNKTQLFSVGEKKLYSANIDAKKYLKKIYLNAADFAKNSTNIAACMDFGISYGMGNWTNITAVDLGCWLWSPNMSNPLSYTIPNKSQIKPWAESLKKDVCSGALSNVVIAPVFAIILATLVSLINQQ